jgi:hypothetical protein
MSRFMLLVFVSLCVPGAVALGSETPTVPDIEAFMQIGYCGSPQITPDGQTVYFISNSSGVAQIYRLNQSDRWPSYGSWTPGPGGPRP